LLAVQIANGAVGDVVKNGADAIGRRSLWWQHRGRAELTLGLGPLPFPDGLDGGALLIVINHDIWHVGKTSVNERVDILLFFLAMMPSAEH
jgi:hypothetical protein